MRLEHLSDQHTRSTPVTKENQEPKPWAERNLQLPARATSIDDSALGDLLRGDQLDLSLGNVSNEQRPHMDLYSLQLEVHNRNAEPQQAINEASQQERQEALNVVEPPSSPSKTRRMFFTDPDYYENLPPHLEY